MLVAAACGDDDEGGGGGDDHDAPDVQSEIGEGEGAVSILAWPYYAEDGTQDPNFDWVTAFEEDTGCDASVKYFGTSDEAFTLFGSGDYDVVSASGDSSMRSVASGDAAAINTDLLDELRRPGPVPQGAGLELASTARSTACPHGWGANVLQYNTEVVDAGSRQLGRRLRPRLAVRREDRGLRLAHLHRRRRGVPDGHRSPTSASRTRTPSTRRSSRRPSTC